MKKHIPELKPVKGMKDSLQEIKSTGLRLGILTSNSKYNVKKFLENNKILMDNKNTIYHIVTLNDLKAHTKDSYYKPANFDKDGFIHCTAEKNRSLLVLEDYFVDISKTNEILILEIDVPKLKPEVKYEPPAPVQGGGTSHFEGSALFPHIYGYLNTEAVTGVGKVERVGNRFVWPLSFVSIEKYLSIRSDWDPDHYLKFKNERTQPSIDLVNRINIDYLPDNIIDIGCGPGNSSQVLLHRWPATNLIGIDNSPAMIEKAKKDYPKQKWLLADAISFESEIKFDIIFSNATIQWIPDHKRLFDKFYSLLSGNGVMAIQLPEFQDMALGQIIHSVSQQKRWKNQTKGCSGLFTYHDFYYYYDLLVDKTKSIDMWESHYIHVMPSHVSIIDWTKSTGMKPYLDRISNENDKNNFEQEVLKEVTRIYPRQSNGNVLFPFKRLFFIGYK